MISSTIFYQREKKSATVKLSLVALMDIFTILVFFLLLNSGEAQKIENAKFVKLPDSTKGSVPHEELMILVNDKEIWVAKNKIAAVDKVLKGSEDIIEPLAQELIKHTEKLGDLTPAQKESGLAVIIMGDRDVPYVLLKSIMATCRLHNFRNISLAVNRIAGSNYDAALPPLETQEAQQGEGT